MASDWYCRIDQTDFGPLTAAELKRMAVDGRLTSTSLVRKGVQGKWVPASAVQGLTFPAATENLATAHADDETSNPPALPQSAKKQRQNRPSQARQEEGRDWSVWTHHFRGCLKGCGIGVGVWLVSILISPCIGYYDGVTLGTVPVDLQGRRTLRRSEKLKDLSSQVLVEAYVLCAVVGAIVGALVGNQTGGTVRHARLGAYTGAAFACLELCLTLTFFFFWPCAPDPLTVLVSAVAAGVVTGAVR